MSIPRKYSLPDASRIDNLILTETTGDITLAVTTSGNDAEDRARRARLNAGDYSSLPFASVQAALDTLPKVLKHDVLLTIGDGTFDGFSVNGFSGPGKLKIKGSYAASTLASGSNNGIAGTGTSTTVVNKPNAASNWTADDLRGKLFVITSGGGASGDSNFPTVRPIKSNTTTSLVVDAVTGMDDSTQFTIADVTTIVDPMDTPPEAPFGLGFHFAFEHCSARISANFMKGSEGASQTVFLAWRCFGFTLDACDLQASAGSAGFVVSCQEAILTNSILNGYYAPQNCQWMSQRNIVIQSSGGLDIRYGVHVEIMADALNVEGTAVRVQDCVSVLCGLAANACGSTPLDAQNCHQFQIDTYLTGSNPDTLRGAKFSRGGQYAVAGADIAGSDSDEFELEERKGSWTELSGVNSGTYQNRGTFLHWGTGYTVNQSKFRVEGGEPGDDFDEFITNNMVVGGIVKHYGAWQSLDPAYKELTAHSGGGQGSAVVVGFRDTVVPTVGSDGDSVRLLSTSEIAYAGGLIGSVANTSTAAHYLNLFPPSGKKIYLHGVDQGANNPITLYPGDYIVWLARNDQHYNVWYVSDTRLVETSGPTALTIGSISSGQVLKRVGNVVQGVGNLVEGNGSFPNLVYWSGSGQVNDSGIDKARVVQAPASPSSTDNTIVRYNGTSGVDVQPTNVVISDTDEIYGHKEKIETVSASTYTFAASDTGKTKVFTNSTGCVVTVPGNLADGWHCRWEDQCATGKVDFSGTAVTPATINNRSGHSKSAGQYASGGLGTYVAGSPGTVTLFGDTGT